MPTVIKGQPTSKEVITELKSMDKPVMLLFSCGKDSIAAWIALEEAGIEVVPVYNYIIPDLEFINEEIEYFQKIFGVKIHQYPHSSIYRLLNNFVFQSPERLRYIEAANFPTPTYEEMDALIREDLGMKENFIADGVRAADSIIRRTAFVKYGVIKRQKLKVSPIADWLKAEVMETIKHRGIKLPIDYEIFGRSFDGLDRRFTEPMKKYLPDDYERLKTWFPLIEVDHIRE